MYPRNIPKSITIVPDPDPGIPATHYGMEVPQKHPHIPKSVIIMLDRPN